MPNLCADVSYASVVRLLTKYMFQGQDVISACAIEDILNYEVIQQEAIVVSKESNSKIRN